MLNNQAAAQLSAWQKTWEKYGAKAGFEPQNFASIGAGLPVPDDVQNIIRELMLDEDPGKFLSKINVLFGLIEAKGQAVAMSIAGPLAKRTPYGTTRTPAGASTEEVGTYELLESEFDPEVFYDIITNWARDPNFRIKIQRMIQRQIGLDIINMGWNGTSEAATVTWLADGSHLPAMHKGWLQRCREENTSRYFSEIVTGSGAVFYGNIKVVNPDNAAIVNVGGGVVGIPATAHGFVAGADINLQGFASGNYLGEFLVLPSSTADQINITATFVAETPAGTETMTQTPDFKSLDELVVTLKSFIPVHERHGHTAFISDEFMTRERGDLYSVVGETPTERMAVPKIMSNIGELPPEVTPFFPDRTIAVTRHNNLSYYRHREAWRSMKVEDSRKAVVFWNLVKDDYVVERYDAMALMENIYKI